MCRFIQEHEHPLGSPSQRSQWPFMRPLEDNEFDGGDEEHWYCAVCHDVGCSDYALICALGCPRVGICHRCAEARLRGCRFVLAAACATFTQL